MDIINNHVGHKLTFEANGGMTDKTEGRTLFERNRTNAQYVAPPKDPREYYFNAGWARNYTIMVYLELKTRAVSGYPREDVTPLNISSCDDA